MAGFFENFVNNFMSTSVKFNVPNIDISCSEVREDVDKILIIYTITGSVIKIPFDHFWDEFDEDDDYITLEGRYHHFKASKDKIIGWEVNDYDPDDEEEED